MPGRKEANDEHSQPKQRAARVNNSHFTRVPPEPREKRLNSSRERIAFRTDFFSYFLACRRELARELLRRGADVNLELVRPSFENVGAFEMSLSCLNAVFVSDDAAPEFVRDFACLLIDAGLQVSELQVFTLLQMFVNGQSSRCLAEIFFKLLRAGAPMDAVSLFPSYFQTTQASTPALAQDEHWSACRALAEGVEAAGGSWAGYRRTPRKEVLRLRSLVLRGRARPHRADDAIMKPIFRLPNELVWKVLGFWRATSDITGEVI